MLQSSSGVFPELKLTPGLICFHVKDLWNREIQPICYFILNSMQEARNDQEHPAMRTLVACVIYVLDEVTSKW